MKTAEISAALTARGIHLDAKGVTFMDGRRVLTYDEVLELLPGTTEDEIDDWAKAEAVRQRRCW